MEREGYKQGKEINKSGSEKAKLEEKTKAIEEQ
jgi:hypothetical protein